METPNDHNRPALDALSRIYRLYDDYINSFSLACRKHCADCCTISVTLTSLEGRMIYAFAGPEKSEPLFYKMLESTNMPRFQPAMTTNQYARLCTEHRDPPEEQFPEKPGVCPLLENDVCSIYPVRPFGCRSMVSSEPCRRTGSAHMDDFTLTVNTMFLQIIEQLDRHGFSGNLVDVLLKLRNSGDTSNSGDTILNSSELSMVSPELRELLLPNEPITALMIPQEHYRKILPLLNTLNHILNEAPAFSAP